MFGCDRDGCLVAMEHEARIEQVTGHRLGSRHGYGSGHEFRLGYQQRAQLSSDLIDIGHWSLSHQPSPCECHCQSMGLEQASFQWNLLQDCKEGVQWQN